MSFIEKPPTDQTSKFREFMRSFLYRWTLRKFRKSKKTVDLGCGWGISWYVNKDFYLVDSDKDCIAFLQNKGASAYLVDLSSELPFSDGFFESAFTHDVLEHLDENEMASLFKEAHRVLRNGGLFMNVVPNRRGYDFGVSEEVGHKRFVTEAEVTIIAEQTGFQFVKAYRSPLKTAGSELFVHNKLVTICRAV